MAFFVTTDELNNAQNEILRTTTANNPFFKASPIAILDKSLKTNKKDIAGAVNELKTSTDTSNLNANNVLTYMNTIVGNNNSAEIKAILAELDTTVIQALYDAIQKVKANESSIMEIKTEITTLQQSISNDEEVEQVLSVLGDGQVSSILDRFPNEKPVTLDINNVEYDEHKHFTVNRETGAITWTFTEANDGFDLEPDFFVNCKYFTERIVEEPGLT